VIWVNHHQLFTRVAAVDLGLLWLNLGLLLSSSVLPFPTAVLSSAFRNRSRSNEVTGSILYALIAALMSFTWLVLFHYLATHERLLARETPASFFVQERRRALLGVLAYLLAAPVALWQPLASLAIICVLPVFYGVTSEGWGRTRFVGA
jgi:TMEM175 potassium channel family protein